MRPTRAWGSLLTTGSPPPTSISVPRAGIQLRVFEPRTSFMISVLNCLSRWAGLYGKAAVSVRRNYPKQPISAASADSVRSTSSIRARMQLGTSRPWARTLASTRAAASEKVQPLPHRLDGLPATQAAAVAWRGKRPCAKCDRQPWSSGTRVDIEQTRACPASAGSLVGGGAMEATRKKARRGASR
jgi:hypothetical protein